MAAELQEPNNEVWTEIVTEGFILCVGDTRVCWESCCCNLQSDLSIDAEDK